MKWEERMRLPALTALLIASASPLAAQTRSPPPVTRDQAMTLPPDALAEIVLRQLGARVTSVTRPNFNRDTTGMEMVSALQHLEFATAPHATNVVGLCAATLIQVDFERPPARPGIDDNRADTPVRASSARAAEVYKVVDEIEPHAEVSEARQAEENRRCAGAGPVIPANYSDREQAGFFNYEGALAPATALLALRRAIGEARAGRYRDIGCPPPAAECRDPAALLGGLDLASLGFVHVSQRGIGNDRDRYRISASFLISADAHEQDYWVFEMEADISERGGYPDPIRRLGPSHFGRSLTIDN
jgi:hypothetical protein